MLFVFTGCQFYPAGEYLRFVRVPENVPVGGEVLQVEVHPRRSLSLQAVDKVRLKVVAVGAERSFRWVRHETENCNVHGSPFGRKILGGA